MKQNKPFQRSLLVVVLLLGMVALKAQDIIYTTCGEIIKAKVKEITPTAVKYIAFDNPDGPLYTLYPSRIDSIVYPNGKVDVLAGVHSQQRGTPRNLADNIPQLNTWSFDLLGFTFLSVSQSYERRLKNGKIGFRVPLYVGFIGGSIAGVGTFKPAIGVYYPYSYYYNNYGSGGRQGSSLATGLNVKCYLFKRRIIRAFAGPEATIGYTSASYTVYNNNNTYYYSDYSQTPLTTYGTFALLGKAGISLNPLDKFNITIDGGAGIGDIFGHEKSNPSPVGFTGLWHIGLTLGTNF